MTVNELIEKLKEYGDEKARDMGKVRVVDHAGNVLDDNIDTFDVKFNVHGVDIPVFAFAYNSSYADYSDEDDFWEDDDEVDCEDDEDYGWEEDSPKDEQ